MDLLRITDATAEPVDVDTAKHHLREDLVDATNDAYIEGLITVARHAAEERLQRTLLEVTWRATFDRFCVNEIQLPRPLLRTVEWIKYYDVDNVQRTLDGGAYTVVTDTEVGLVMPAATFSWPGTYSRAAACSIQYTAGYGAAGEPEKVPQPIKHWILLAVAFMYEHRLPISANSVNEFRFVDSLLDAYRVYGV